MKRRSLWLLVCAALTLPGGILRAEELPTPATQPGKWTFTMSEPGADLKKIGAPRLKKIKGNLQEVARLITATPVMSPPTGFEVRFWGSAAAKDRYDICRGKGCPPSRPTAVLAMMVGRYEEKNGKLRAAFNTPATMDISINNLGHVFAHLPVLYKDEAGFLLPEPASDGQRAGMPVFLNDGHAVAVLARNNGPFWLPVSRERYLKAAIAKVSKELGLPSAPEPRGKKAKKGDKGKTEPVAEKATTGKPILVEDYRSWVDPADEQLWVERSRSLTERLAESTEILQERLQQLQAALAALTPEEAAMPARVDGIVVADNMGPPLLAAGSSGGVAVVTPNFGYFNPKLSPEAIQLLVVQWKFDGNTCYDPQRSDISDTRNNQALLEIFKTLDWNKLAAKITRTGP